MKLSIHQPMYIPWIPYFFKIIQSDIFVFFDDVQYPRSKNFNNRNYIKSKQGHLLLTISIKKKSNLLNINKTEINKEINWQKKHWKSIYINYKESKYFSKYSSYFEDLYLNKEWKYISDLCIEIIKLIAKISKFETQFFLSSNLNIKCDNSKEKIINIIKNFNADIYITGKGQGSLKYLNNQEFKEKNIAVKYCSYDNFTYNQLHGSFIKDCSILDLFFNYGENTRQYLLNNSSLNDF